MRHTRIAALIVTCAAAIIPAAPLFAQGTPRPTTQVLINPIRPQLPVAAPVPNPELTVVSNGMPEAGPYKLEMTATTIAGQPAGSGHVVSKNVSVTWSGATIAITEAGGPTLQGLIANNHLTASSQTSDGSLSLSGTASAHHASGTFNVTQADGRTASGGFVLIAPGPNAMLAKVQQWGTPKTAPAVDPCNWWCQFKAWF